MKKNIINNLKHYVDGEANTFFEYIMLFVIFINTITLGLETVTPIEVKYGNLLFIIDQICLWIFIFELLLKIVAYNKEFFGEIRENPNGEKYFHINKWNIFDLLIVLISTIGSLPFFSIFRLLKLFKSIKIVKGIKSLRIVKTFKLINGITSLRVMVKAIIKAFPSVLWTFFLLLIFTYVYAVIGTNIFAMDFPDYFGNLRSSFLSLLGLFSIDTSEVISTYSWAWIYFITYSFFEASIIMNVIVGVIVDAVNESQEEINTEENKVTLESLSKQIEELKREIINNH